MATLTPISKGNAGRVGDFATVGEARLRLSLNCNQVGGTSAGF